MKFQHADFRRSKGLPESLIQEGLIKDYYFFYLENGPKLMGPYPVIIDRQNNKKIPHYGELFIKAGKEPYWENYGQPNIWETSGYYLVFKTFEEIRNEKEFILI